MLPSNHYHCHYRTVQQRHKPNHGALTCQVHTRGCEGLTKLRRVVTEFRKVSADATEASYLPSGPSQLERIGPLSTPMSVLFKLELAPYGYTFVSTGALPGHPRLLEHESRIYARLNRLQGEVVPVHLGLAWLHRGYILPGKARVFHMMLMSWGGEAMADMVATGAGTADLPAEVRRSSQAVWDEGVDHGDERDANRYCFLFEHFQGPGPLEVLAPGKEIPYTASPTTADLSSIPSELLVDIAARR